MSARRWAALAACFACVVGLLWYASGGADATPQGQTGARETRVDRARSARDLFVQRVAEARGRRNSNPHQAPASGSPLSDDEAGDTGLDDLPPSAVLRGHVDNPTGGDARVFLVCEADALLQEVYNMPSVPFPLHDKAVRSDGSFGPMVLLEGLSCVVRARRRDGLLYAMSAPVHVQSVADDDLWADLSLPPDRTGGIGVALQQEDRGVRAMQVYQGTPAYDAGLESGDLIVAVEGESVAALSLDEFIEAVTGPVGTSVEFTVEFDGDTGLTEETYVLERKLLERALLEG